MKFISNNSYNKVEKKQLSDIFRKSDINKQSIMSYSSINDLLIQYFGNNEAQLIIV